MNCPLGAITPRSGLPGVENYCRREVIFSFWQHLSRGGRGGWGRNVCFIFAIRSNKIMINLWLGTVDWKLFITKSPANPIRSFAEFLFGRIKFCESWGQILQISAGHTPQHNSEQINQIRPHVERAAAVFAIFPDPTFYPTPIPLSILAVSSISPGRMASVPKLMNLADILANPVIIRTVMMNLGINRSSWRHGVVISMTSSNRPPSVTIWKAIKTESRTAKCRKNSQFPSKNHRTDWNMYKTLPEAQRTQCIVSVFWVISTDELFKHCVMCILPNPPKSWDSIFQNPGRPIPGYPGILQGPAPPLPPKISKSCVLIPASCDFGSCGRQLMGSLVGGKLRMLLCARVAAVGEGGGGEEIGWLFCVKNWSLCLLPGREGRRSNYQTDCFPQWVRLAFYNSKCALVRNSCFICTPMRVFEWRDVSLFLHRKVYWVWLSVKVNHAILASQSTIS